LDTVQTFPCAQAVRKQIPVRIKNVENPTGGGTVIHPEADLDGTQVQDDQDSTTDQPSVVSLHQLSLASDGNHHRRKLPTAVTIKEHIIVLNINSNRKSVSHGFLAGIFGTLDRFGVVVDLISTSEVHVSMAIEDNLTKRVLDRLVKELRKSGTVRAHTPPNWIELITLSQVSVHGEMAILSLVGRQMRQLIGVAGRMFSTLGQGNVNIEMISQGASEINISCVIDGRDAVKALNLIHQSCLQIKPEGARGRGVFICNAGTAGC
jgi:aspartate kinase